MFDLISLLQQVAQNPSLAPHLDAMGIPAPSTQGIMKLGAPPGGVPPTGTMTNPGDLGPLIGGQNTNPLGFPPSPVAAAPSSPTGTLTPEPTGGPAPPSLGPAVPDPSVADILPNAGDLGSMIPTGSTSPGIGPFSTTVTPEPPSTAAPAAGNKSSDDMLRQLAALKGIVAPNPVQPITSAGVPGGNKPPDTKAINNVGAPAIQALLAALLGGGGMNPLRVPQLGSIMR